MHKEHINIITKSIIRSLWKEFNDKFIATFANVNISMSITTHKAQSSTYFNVFVDADDILNNINSDEAKRSLYTACSRTSNELHILI